MIVNMHIFCSKARHRDLESRFLIACKFEFHSAGPAMFISRDARHLKTNVFLFLVFFISHRMILAAATNLKYITAAPSIAKRPRLANSCPCPLNNNHDLLSIRMRIRQGWGSKPGLFLRTTKHYLLSNMTCDWEFFRTPDFLTLTLFGIFWVIGTPDVPLADSTQHQQNLYVQLELESCWIVLLSRNDSKKWNCTSHLCKEKWNCTLHLCKET